MSTFKALNIESDDESDIEIDDTKEIQIEEALKLYQTALKYHSEGPQSYDKAADAYRALFESDIFKYPESLSELRRLEQYGLPAETDDVLQDELEAGAVAIVNNSDNGPSTLPQILHLSYKNHGEFMLELLQSRIRGQVSSVAYPPVTQNQVAIAAAAALNYFVEALDKDDSDLDLWRRSSAVAGVLGSRRIERFCLEAVLDGDEEGVNGVLSLPGLEEALAGLQLKDLVERLRDQLSLGQPPLTNIKKRKASTMLQRKLAPYPTISITQQQWGEVRSTLPHPARFVLQPPNDWAELGDLILRQMLAEQHGGAPAVPGSGIVFDLSLLSPQPAALKPRSPSSGSPSRVSAQDMASTVGEQFPGLDQGKLTLLPQSEQLRIADTVTVPAEPAGTVSAATEGASMTLPTRKRSTDAAGLHDTGEGRTKSKRLRARESLADTATTHENIVPNLSKQYQADLDYFQSIDACCFEAIGALMKEFGVHGFELAQDLQLDPYHKQGNANAESIVDVGLRNACTSLTEFLRDNCDNLAPLLFGQLANGSPDADGVTKSGNSKRAGFEGASKTEIPSMPPNVGLYEWLLSMDDDWYHVKDIAFAWLMSLLRAHDTTDYQTTYTRYRWSERLKTMVVRMIVNLDDHIYEKLREPLDEFATEEARVIEKTNKNSADDMARTKTDEEVIQTLFELHLDVYSLIKEPNSGVDQDTVVAQGDRLQRWCDLARTAMRRRADMQDQPSLSDPLNLRHLWALTFHLNVCDDVTQEHVIACLDELRAIFKAAAEPVIELVNNAVMPELSVATIDGEVSRLTTKDFFEKVFDESQTDPMPLIESLEPMLEYLIRNPVKNDDEAVRIDHDEDTSRARAAAVILRENTEVENLYPEPPGTHELIAVLRDRNVSVQIMLWQRLRQAYEAINYIPMIVSCYFRGIELQMSDIKNSQSRVDVPPIARQINLLKILRQLPGLVNPSLRLVQSSEDALECMDNERLRSIMNALVELLQLLHAFNAFEDTIRISQRQPLTTDAGLPLMTLPAITVYLHDLEIRTWMILYLLFKEALGQNRNIFSTPNEDRFEFLQAVHRSVGARGFVHESNRIFLKLLKQEVFQLTMVDRHELELSQVLYDMYGIKCYLNPAIECLEHRSPPEPLDKNVALQTLDLLMAQASRLTIRDLVKHPLKDTIDKVHGALVRKKPTDAILRNREVYRAYLKSPINPIELYKCLQGEGQLTTVPVQQEQAVPAAKGWYFLMGHIALSKFRSQKRTGPSPTEDIDIAIAFFMQDLEYSMDHWETWYRLAQAYDSKVEESITWSSEKINSSPHELAQLQRAAIHCYTLATALAMRSADLAFETSSKMADLYADFAMRIYASSREPLSMQAFSLGDVEKYFSTHTVIKGKPFKEMRVFVAWRFAKVLFQRALAGNPKSWTLHFALGKCLWKMHSANEAVRGHDQIPSTQQVLQAFIRAVEHLPEKRDSRDTKREPILEPHYKLVSIVHKMVQRRDLSPSEGCRVLEASHHACSGAPCEDLDHWEPYILSVLKNVRTADKSNWHHRMVARAAHIIYDYDEGDFGSAIGAKHELTQQIFTKTMVMNVWRPDNERPGRHFVYTTRYVRFFVKLLEQLMDRASLDALARRVRKRTTDFFEHGALWLEICSAYLRVLRRYGQVPIGHETTIFSTLHEDFPAHKDALEKWCQDPEASANNAVHEVLKEVMEIKRVNQSLCKPAAIDDLIGDAYALLYDTVGRRLWREQEANAAPPAPTPQVAPVSDSTQPKTNSMSLAHLMNIDNTSEPSKNSPMADTPTPADPAPAARRKVGVGRREIRAAAEACVAKATAAALVPTRQTTLDGRAQMIRGLPGPDVESRTESRAGSIHDSADDESELSDVDESVVNEAELERKVRKPIFPGLTRRSPEVVVEADYDDAEEMDEDVDMAGVDLEGVAAEADGAEALGDAVDGDLGESIRTVDMAGDSAHESVVPDGTGAGVAAIS
ncbi:hypothetical protein LTR28_010003 [Elasticomyces elasticus]|nr:hypothetical protein LTR28_010003 [Elasticomyces elasticus]